MDLSTPLRLRRWTLANRAVLAPMVPNCAGDDGGVTREFADFYRARAKGGVGLLIIGATYVHPDGKGFRRQLGICGDHLNRGLESLAATLREAAVVGIQLSFKNTARFPEDYTLAEIDKYRRAFVEAARRARACGFDAVELHACHDYWLNYFLSPHFNRRRDHYGGSLENRARLLLETVAAIRDEVGEEILVGARLSMEEFIADGLTLAETLQVGKWLAAAGVDYISASGGIGKTQYRMSPPMEIGRGSLLALARALRQQVNIPVVGVGRLDRPQVFRAAVAEGYADLAAAARAMIADPEFAGKTLRGEDQEIRPCIACNYCLLCLHRDEAVRCTVNPWVGRDLMQPPPLAGKPKVVVIGGGPGGLSAATAAANRGAEVKLFERRPYLGGAVNLAKIPPHKEVLQDLIDYLVEKARESGVELVLGVEADKRAIEAERADAVIVATGATNVLPEVPGLRQCQCLALAADILQATEIPPGEYLVVGGGAVGLETAEFLVAAGARVKVIEMTAQLGRGLHATRLHLLLERLAITPVPLLVNTRLVEVLGNMVKVATPGGEEVLGPFQRLVFATGYRGQRRIAAEFGGDVQAKIVGDAKEPRTIYEAITEGFEAALELRAPR